MVFESVIADVLNIYLGDYVENLDRSQLQVGIWGGDVVLQDLILKPNIFDALNLPLKCIFGHLGRLVLKIPWKNLYSAPVIATVEQLFILAAPDTKCQTQSSHQAKQAELQRLEVAWRLKKETNKAKTSDTFVEKLATQIIKNIQIRIQDIHVRYEDAVTNPRCPFSVGITLHKLSVQSTDKNWREGMVQDTLSMIYKVLNLQGLAMYWNCHCSQFPEAASRKDTLKLFQDGILGKTQLSEKFVYMLGPINSAARLQLNPKPEKDDFPFKFPKVILTLLMDTLALGITKQQYHSLLELLDFFSYAQKVSEYQKFKPLVPRKRGHYKEWWKFAINCTLSHRWRRIEWEQVKKHRAACRDYASAYKEKLEAAGPLPADTQEVLLRCEAELDIYNIMLIRRQAEAEVEWLSKTRPKEPKPQGVISWLGSWWSGASTGETDDFTDKLRRELTAEERLKLYQAIDYDENADPAQYPEQFVERQVIFHLGKLTTEIRDNASLVLSVTLSGVFCTLEQRPSANAFKMSLKMTELGAWGAGDGTTSPQLVKSLTTVEDGSETVLMQLLIETNPLDKLCGRRLHIRAAPLQLIYDAHTAAQLAAIFQGPQSEVLVQLQAAAGAQLSEMSALGLQYAIEHHTVTDIAVDMKSSYVIVPYEGTYNGRGDLRDVLVMNLGQLRVITLPRDVASNLRLLYDQGFAEEQVVAMMREESYDRFLVELKHVQVLFALAGEDWEAVLHGEKSAFMHLLEPTSFSCQIEKCLVQNDPSLPNVKVSGKLSTVSCLIEDNRLVHLIQLYESIPLSGAKEDTKTENRGKSNVTFVDDGWENDDRPSEHSVPADTVKLEMKFSVEGVTISLFRSATLQGVGLPNSEPEKMLVLRSPHLGLSLVQRTFEMSVTAHLGGISLVYLSSNKPLMLLDPCYSEKEKEADMLTIKYTWMDKRDDLPKNELHVQQFIEADFSNLAVLLHQEILLALMAFAETLGKRLQAVPSTSGLPHSLQETTQQKVVKPKTSLKTVKPPPRKNDLGMKVSIRLHAFSVCLLQCHRAVAHFMVEGMEAEALTSKLSTRISAHLKNACVLDPSPTTLHNKIMSILDREVLSLEVVIFHNDKKDSNKGVNMSVRAQLARSRIVFLNSFIQTVLGFLNSFQKAQENIAQVVADAAEAAKQKVLHAHAESQFVVLDIKLQAPLIVVPVSSTCLEVLQLDFGQLLIKNKLETNISGPVDVIKLDLQQLQVTRATLSAQEDVEVEQKLIQPVSFTLQLTRSLMPASDFSMPGVVMRGHLDNLEASVNRDDVHMLMRILAENFENEDSKSATNSTVTVKSKKEIEVQKEATLSWELSLNLSTLKLHLGLDPYNQINFAMTGSDFAIRKKKDMQVSFRVRDLVAANPFATSSYQKVVAVEGTEALSLDVVMYDQKTGHNDDMAVKASMARIRVIYLPSLISALKDFLLVFNYKQERIVEAMAGVAEAAKEEVIEAHNQATKISLNVDLKAPVIILPYHRTGNEALLLDFGNLTVQNKFEAVADPLTEEQGIIDCMTLGLHNLKISRIELGASGDFTNEYCLLQPVSLCVEMKRNLCPQKFNAMADLDFNGHLKTVAVALNQEDIQLVMGVLTSFSASSPQESDNSATHSEMDVETPEGAQEETSSVTVTFSFTMDKLVVELFDEKPELLDFLNAVSPVHAIESSLARCSFILLVIHGTMAGDGTISTSLQLTDCQLDDSRQEQQARLVRLFEKKHEEKLSDNSSVPVSRNMEISYHKKGLVSKVKVHVYSFNLILSLEYLHQLRNFLSKAFEQTEQKMPKGPDLRAAVYQQFSNLPSSAPGLAESAFSLFVHAENPDIFLVEDMGDPKTTSLVLKSDIQCAFYQTPAVTEVNGAIRGLQIYSCCYHPDYRKSTMSQILQPCNMKVEGNTSHIEVDISDVRLRVSPGAINLLSRVLTAVYSREEIGGEIQNTTVNYTDLWVPKTINETDHWFLKAEVGEEALHMADKTQNQLQLVQKSSEVCILKMPSLSVTVEAGAGTYTLPMIMLTAGISALARNWSSKLVVEGIISLQMAYYNSHLALWEPLIEPVEVHRKQKTTRKPWELDVKMEMENNSTENASEVVEKEHSSMSMSISSREALELTLTKTCLEVLKGLGQAFQLVGDEVHREGPLAPYHIVNHTGLALSLLLDVGPFKEYSQWNEKGHAVRLVQPGESVPLRATDQVTLSSPLSLLAQGQAQEKFLRIMFNDFGNVLDLPTVQAGQRYFSLNGEWGLVSDVCVEFGSTIVTLRSVVQVYNNLGMPIDIHCQPQINSELKYAGTVPSGEHIDLPFRALYTPMRELHISVPGYKKISYAWAQEFSLMSAVLHECRSIQRSSRETVFLRILREKCQAYSEATKTQGAKSTYYKIYIQPAVKLKNLLPVGIILSQPEISVIHALAPGDRFNIATARPDGSKISLQIPDYRQEEWHCSFPLDNASDKEFFQIMFKNRRGKLLSVGAHTMSKRGVFIITLYSPYWMLNKTGLPLSYKLSDGSATVSHHSTDARAAVMFPSFSGTMKAAVQVADGEWSEAFSLDVAGSTGIVNCPALGQIYRIGVSVQLMRCTLTKQVTFTPYYVLINTCQHAVACQEANRPADLWVKVEAGDCRAFWPVNPDNPVRLRARMSGTSQITASFSCSVAHTTLLRLDNQWGGLNVDVQLTDSSVYITLAGYELGQAAVLFVNYSDVVIPFSEKGSSTINMLNPGTELLFTWMEPSGSREIDFMLQGKSSIDKDVCQFRRDACGFVEACPGEYVFWSSFLDGAQRVMLFSRNPVVTQNAQDSVISQSRKRLNVNIPGLGLSVVDNAARVEVLYIGVRRMPDKLRERYNSAPGVKKTEMGFWMQVAWLPNEMQIHAKLDHLQADCQLPECTYPVALAPVPPSRSVAASHVARPFMEFSAVVHKAKHSSLQQVQYCKALLQPFHVKVDMGLMSALAALLEAGEPSDEVEVAQFLEDFLLVKALLPAHVALGTARDQKLYFQLLHFSPVKIHLSLSLSRDAGVQKGHEPPPALRVLLHSLGVTLTNVQDVVFRLAYFERQETLLSNQQLVSQASEHYRSQVLKQLYVLVLGLDVLGNPLNFVKGLKRGVEDMFYEPIQGAIQGPEEFAHGLALGVRSLFGHTVGGALGAASRITGAMGSGVAALTFDDEYQRKRQEARSNRPTSVTKGLAQSGEGLVMGVVDGVSGVFLKPISGAKKEGVEGFFKGFGKGMAGLVARPTAGIIDFASGSFDALRRTTETSLEVERQRPPRFFRSDGRVRPYIYFEAEGHKMLQELENREIAGSDIYDYHAHIESSEECMLMLTNKRVMLISRSGLYETWKVEWQLPWESVEAPVAIDTGIFFPFSRHHSRPQSKGSSSRRSGYRVDIKDRSIVQEILSKMNVLMK